MVLSASRRTDIPCYYSEWFINRLKAGFALTRNPMNRSQISRVPLSPNIVDCIVFWTKDAKNIIPQLRTIDKMGYKYYFQFTLTPYDSTIERNLRDKSEIENTFIELGRLIGKERVLWRYDPIILNNSITADWHKEQFARLCEKLSPYTEQVQISFVDMYKKLKTDLIAEILTEEIGELGEFIGKTAKDCGIAAKACCEKTDLTRFGIEQAHCIGKSVIEKICGYSLEIKADKFQREGCGCVQSTDIGAYNSCLNGCVYCYATNGAASCLKRYNSHDSNSEILIGSVAEGEKIINRKVKSNKIVS